MARTREAFKKPCDKDRKQEKCLEDFDQKTYSYVQMLCCKTVNGERKPATISSVLQGEFKLNDFITHTMGLEDINKAFDLMHEGKSIRTVIHYDK